jgi:hypothetical protein
VVVWWYRSSGPQCSTTVQCIYRPFSPSLPTARGLLVGKGGDPTPAPFKGSGVPRTTVHAPSKALGLESFDVSHDRSGLEWNAHPITTRIDFIHRSQVHARTLEPNMPKRSALLILHRCEGIPSRAVLFSINIESKPWRLPWRFCRNPSR